MAELSPVTVTVTAPAVGSGPCRPARPAREPPPESPRPGDRPEGRKVTPRPMLRPAARAGAGDRGCPVSPVRRHPWPRAAEPAFPGIPAGHGCTPDVSGRNGSPSLSRNHPHGSPGARAAPGPPARRKSRSADRSPRSPAGRPASAGQLRLAPPHPDSLILNADDTPAPRPGPLPGWPLGRRRHAGDRNALSSTRPGPCCPPAPPPVALCFLPVFSGKQAEAPQEADGKRKPSFWMGT